MIDREYRVGLITEAMKKVQYELLLLKMQIKNDPLLRKSLNEFLHDNLSIRSKNSLKNAGINKLGDIIDISFSQLKTIKHLGAKSANEVREALASKGFYLK